MVDVDQKYISKRVLLSFGSVLLLTCPRCGFPGKLPKNFDPKATPDPERWLPMRERTYYRGKKKGKKKEQVGKGTQGTTAGGSADL